MKPIEMLSDMFRRFEDAKSPVCVSFDDGSRYELRIISTEHAEAGGDIVADVLRNIEGPGPDLWKTAAMNFKLEDVVRVESREKCVFAKHDGQR